MADTTEAETEPGTDLDVLGAPAEERDPLPPGIAEEADRARKVGAQLKAAAAEIPVRQIRYELGARGAEWVDAARDLEMMARAAEDGGPLPTIELAGNVVRAMKVPSYSEDDSVWIRVKRVLHREGTVTLHVEVRDGGRVVQDYRDLADSSSPVVVLA